MRGTASHNEGSREVDLRPALRAHRDRRDRLLASVAREPSATDQIDWQRGAYMLVERRGSRRGSARCCARGLSTSTPPSPSTGSNSGPSTAISRPLRVGDGSLPARAERFFFRQQATIDYLRWKEAPSAAALMRAANQYAEFALAGHRQYAATAGIAGLAKCVEALEAKLEEIRDRDDACLVALGWGTGIYGKTVWPKLDDEVYRRILGRQAVYARAIKSGFPFPKTRRMVFQNDQPAAIPGWAVITVG